MGRMAEGRWRLTAHAAAALLIVAALTACTPDPTPTPSPTGFASEAEAFAAAEDTYRAYIDASNAQTDGGSADPLEFLTGQALEDAIESENELVQEGLTLTGPLEVLEVAHLAADRTTATIRVCLDLSKSRVLDSSGADVTPTGRAERFSVDVGVIWTGSEPLITTSEAGAPSC